MSSHIWTLSEETRHKIDQTANAAQKGALQRAYYLQYRTSFLFASILGFIILGLFVATLLIFALFRLHRYGLSKSKGRAHAGSALGAFSRSISEAPLFGTRRAQPYSALHGFLSFRAPVRLHTVVIFCFCLTNILCITSFYETWAGPDNPRYPTKSTYTQLSKYFSDRTAVLCISYLPIVILLSGRNSIATFLTGMTFSTQMLYHRWVGRMVALLALCHGGGYTANYVARGVLPTLYKKVYVPTGIVALVALCCLCFFSLPVIRKFSYEIFLLSHVLFAALTIGCTFVHVQKLEADTRMRDMYTLLRFSIAAWVFDRVLRLARIAYMSLSFSRHTAPRAEVSLAAPDILAIKVYPIRPIRASASQYMNICFPTLQPWAIHPFSVIKVEETGQYCVHFVARVHAGITRQLARQVNRASGGTWSGVALLEGPYGQAIKPEPRGDLLLLAGGMGITPCLSVLLARDFASFAQDEEKNLPASLRLVWAIRDHATINVALPYLLELQASLQAAGARLHLDIFLTGAASRPSQDPSHNPAAKDTEKEVYTTPDTPLSNLSSNDRFAQSLAYFPSKHEPKLEMLDLKYICVNIQEGRPDLDTIMKVADADQRPLTVVVCGPATMSDHARRVALNISRARKVHFFEECFDW